MGGKIRWRLNGARIEEVSRAGTGGLNGREAPGRDSTGEASETTSSTCWTCGEVAVDSVH